MYIDLKTKQEQSGRLEELLIQLVFLYQQTLQCVFSSKYDNEKNGGSFFIRTCHFSFKGADHSAILQSSNNFFKKYSFDNLRYFIFSN